MFKCNKQAGLRKQPCLFAFRLGKKRVRTVWRPAPACL